jgi:hypothetical protein
MYEVFIGELQEQSLEKDSIHLTETFEIKTPQYD